MENKDKPKTIIGNRRPAQTTSNRQTNSRNQTKASRNRTQSYPVQRSRTSQSSLSRQSGQNTGRVSSGNSSASQRSASQRSPGGTSSRTSKSQRARSSQARSAQSTSQGRIASRVPADRTQHSANRQSIAQPVQAPSKQKRKRHPKLKKRLIQVCVILLCVFGAAFAYLRFSPLNPELGTNASAYNISSNAASMAASERIVNVAVFGIDARSDVEGERSDSIMIASADFEHNKLKVTSLMRDTYVYIEEEDSFDKLNAAYSIGGPSTALKVINENFDMAITDYVTVDFTALVTLVNAVGGVEINVESEEEMDWINQYLWDVNDKVGTHDAELTQTGLQTLTGSQALAYTRIRYVGNGDYERTQRQRNVLQQVLTKAKSLGPIKLISMVNDMMPYIQTSLSKTEIMKYLLNVMLISGSELEQFRLPTDNYVTDDYLDGVSYVFPDTLVDNIEAWYEFVYEKDYTPSSTAQEISEEIEEVLYGYSSYDSYSYNSFYGFDPY